MRMTKPTVLADIIAIKALIDAITNLIIFIVSFIAFIESLTAVLPTLYAIFAASYPKIPSFFTFLTPPPIAPKTPLLLEFILLYKLCDN